MLTYTPAETIVHRLDPRAKLCFQFGFAIAAFASPTPLWLAGLFAVGIGILALSGLTVRRALRAYWVVLLILSVGPLIAAITIGPPWLRLDPAIASLRSVARVVPILLVSAAYIHSTPIRDTRAAIQRTIPGRPGQLLGVGVALTFRYIPVLRDDLRQVRDAVRARGGDTRSLRERSGRIVTLTLARALDHSDRLAVALQTRCFAWNPTLPRLQCSLLDYLVVCGSLVLAGTAVLAP